MQVWTFIDKTKWPERGPWDGEPDKAQWIDTATGLDCLMVRASSHWCGYVGVGEGHPAFKLDYGEVDVDVHGGLTYADFCQKDNKEHGICHIHGDGRSDIIWWLGFDCAHIGDKRPCTDEFILAVNKKYGSIYGDGTYRDFAYVQAEVTLLAKQLHQMKKGE